MISRGPLGPWTPIFDPPKRKGAILPGVTPPGEFGLAFFDDFNRADNNDPGVRYMVGGGAGGVTKIMDNMMVNGDAFDSWVIITDPVDNGTYWNLGDQDVSVEADLFQLGASATRFAFLGLRAITGAAGYQAHLSKDGNFEIAKGGSTQATVAAGGWTYPLGLKLEAIGGEPEATVNVYARPIDGEWTLVLSWVDVDPLTFGAPSVRLYGFGFSNPVTDRTQIDNLAVRLL